MRDHDGDITPGMNSYYGDEAAANLDAIKIMEKINADVMTTIERRVVTSTCTKQGCSGHPVLEAFRLHVMGSGVFCQTHLEEYYGKPLADILEAKRKSNAVVHYCARCGKRGRWISGAGLALCSRHEDDY